MTLVRLGAACFMLAGALGANAQDKPCTKADAAAAEKAIERVVMWTQLEKAWHDYRHCDSGAVGDLYTDALLRLLVDWKKPEALAEAVAKDPQYKAFVIAHIRSPVAKDDREAIYSRAKADCPGNLAAFCSEIADAAKVK
ncbi:MAG: hypothetical protein ACM3SO_15485 [Betaproteobacteria bacterium]